jgi:hypothetical protein
MKIKTKKIWARVFAGFMALLMVGSVVAGLIAALI